MAVSFGAGGAAPVQSVLCEDVQGDLVGVRGGCRGREWEGLGHEEVELFGGVDVGGVAEPELDLSDVAVVAWVVEVFSYSKVEVVLQDGVRDCRAYCLVPRGQLHEAHRVACRSILLVGVVDEVPHAVQLVAVIDALHDVFVVRGHVVGGEVVDLASDPRAERSVA